MNRSRRKWRPGSSTSISASGPSCSWSTSSCSRTEMSSILLIMAPILFPLATKIGIHPVHLGVLMIVNTEVGLCHPPVGLNLYIASSIAKMGISEITIAVLPWLCAMLVFLGLITYVPEISLWLPRLLGMIG